MIFSISDVKVAIVGLGYVGLPLFAEFNKHFVVKGYDINPTRIASLKNGVDETLEVEMAEVKEAFFTSDIDDIADCNFYIITVPTPIDNYKSPDLTALESASTSIGKILKYNDVVVFESTVFPGAIEEICIPLLCAESKMNLNKDFFVGYSPERINPGDQARKVPDIMKVTSGSNAESAKFIDQVYGQVISAGTHLADSIRTAEAAKVIENVQRDINIALMNELCKLFDRMGLDTKKVLEAACTKWNFLNFEPGLVGGHCIGVDPYYLTYKAEQFNFNTELISASRRINDTMPYFVTEKILKHILLKKIDLINLNILIMGCTFKENCPDVRNSKVFEIHERLTSLNLSVDVYDPLADKLTVKREYDVELLNSLPSRKYQVVILAVKHQEFIDIRNEYWRQLILDDTLIFDLKYCLPDNLDIIRI